MEAKSKKIFQIAKKTPQIGGVRRTRGGRWRGKGRQAPRVRREYESTKHYLERFAPCVNAGCGGLNTLTRNRRTFIWSSFVWAAQKVCYGFRRSCAWVAQNVCYGFRQDFARILPRLWASLAMGRPPNCPLERKNRSSEGQKSSSDRPGDSREQPKSLQENKFRVFSSIFENFWKILKPKSALERPKSRPGAPRRTPESPREASQGTQAALGDHFEG